MFKPGGHKKGGGIAGIFRLFLSLIIMAVLGIGLLQAYKSFSGYDPLKISPTSFKSLLTSEGAYQFVISLLTFKPDISLLKDKQSSAPSDSSDNTPGTNSPLSYKFAVMADSHKDTQNLSKALSQAKSSGAKFVVMMGDLSDVGTKEELQATKNVLDSSKLTYYISPGDHDLWDSRDKSSEADRNFKDIFGPTYQSFSDSDVRFIMIYNSDNYLGLDGLQLSWVEDELARIPSQSPKLVFAFAPTPLYHPSSDHFMGKVTPKLKDQAEHLASIFKKSGVNLVFSADTHFFTQYTEPTNDLKMVTVGAVTSERNPQSPRFAIVDIYEDGSYNIEETEIK